MLRRGLVAVGAVVVAYWLVLPLAFVLVTTHRPRVEVKAAELGRPHEDVVLHTSDGLALAGWYVPSRNGAAVLVVPRRTGTLDHARMPVRRGFGVLLVDMRGQGESEGDPNALGWGSNRDVDAAVAYLRARPDVDGGRIGGLGLSVGGELLLETAAANEGLRAVVSDCAGERSVRESVLRGPSGRPALPLQAVLTASVAMLGGEGPPPTLQSLIGRIAPRPVLLVQAGKGQGGEDLNPEYAAAAGEGTSLWLIEEAAHTRGLDARPAEYERRVVGLFDRALGSARG